LETVFRRTKKPPPGEIGDGFHLMAPAYLSEELIEVNLSLRFDPRPFTTAMMASVRLGRTQ
jgi:hypothetical protein